MSSIEAVNALHLDPSSRGMSATPEPRARGVYQEQAKDMESASGRQGQDARPAIQRSEKGFRLGPFGVFIATENEETGHEHLVHAAISRADMESGRLFQDSMDVAEVFASVAAAPGSVNSGGPLDSQPSLAADMDSALRAYARAGAALEFIVPGSTVSSKI